MPEDHPVFSALAPIHDEVFGPTQRLDVLIGHEAATG
jgi:hypothetical protein